MFTTGSKLLLGSALLATIATIVYGITQDGVMGTTGLASASAALWFLAGVNVFTFDSNVVTDDALAVSTCAATDEAPANSIWPMAFALGAAVLAVGLVTYQAVFIVGIVLLLAAGAEWTAQAWSERASAEASHNAQVRSRIANPLEFPLAAAIGVGIIVYSFSRVMLWLSKTNTVIAFVVLAAIVVSIAFLFAYRPRARSRAVVGIMGFGVLALIFGGAAAGLDGERDIEARETTAELAPEGICESPDVFEADEEASQSVAATSATAARITLEENGELTFSVPGPLPEGATALTLPRSNPNNVLFSNNSGEERRLSLDLGPAAAEDGAEGDGELNQICTTLVEPDSLQNLTLIVGIPSAAVEGGYSFFVPGVATAELELVVP